MALVLSVRCDGEDYILIRHRGETIRIAVKPARNHNLRRASVVFMAAGQDMAPDSGWDFVRGRALRREAREARR